MASFFRWRIANKVIPLLSNYTSKHSLLNPSIISSFVKVNRIYNENSQLLLPWKRLSELFFDSNNFITPKELVKCLRSQGLPTAEGITDISLCSNSTNIVFTVDKHVLSKIVLMDICANDEIVAKSSCLFQNIPSQNVVIQCRSPHIGECFQMTHFRCAIHCNFIGNINVMAGHKVTKVMHFADWGLTTAALLLGYRQYGIKAEMENNPCQHLSDVLIATQLLYKNDPGFARDAKQCLQAMENGDESIIAEWKVLRKISLNRHVSTFKKIGLSFDEIIFDSSHFSEIKNVEKELVEKELLLFQNSNEVKASLKNETSISYEEMESFVYSIGRAIFFSSHLKKKFDFEKLLYIAPTSEKNYYNVLFQLIKDMDLPFSQNLQYLSVKPIKDFTVKGRQKQEAEKVLHQAKLALLEMLKKDLYISTDASLEEAAERLSLAAICVNDMKRKRKADYSFDWKEVLNFGLNTGISLQLCCAGLKGLQKDSDYIFDVEYDTSPLVEWQSQNLIQHLSRLDEIVHKAYLTLEPYIILQYLFSLWHFADQASDVMKLDIREERLTVIKARLMLLSATLKVLEKGLLLLGIKPYETNYTPPEFFNP